jgi:hypothetical protein
MSYLDLPRLTFFGQFTADPSTINNGPANYGQPLPYIYDPPGNTTPPGYVFWNPYGTHSFSLDCAVTNVNPGPAERGSVMSIQPNKPGCAVLVDLDTEQQMVSQIIGMQLTVTVGSGSVTGNFEPVNFFDIYFSRMSGSNPIASGDGVAGAAYQSVLTDLQWNEAGSSFLRCLKEKSPTMLSIRFNVDAYNMFYNLPTFNVGRVAGTIGPQFPGEPTSFTNARFLRPIAASGWNYAPAKVDSCRGKLIVDLGNATAFTWNTGQPAPTSNVASVQVATISFNGSTPQSVIDTIPQVINTTDADYQANAFVQELDIPQSMLSTIGSTPLGIVSNGAIVMAENPTGAYINADQYVFRLNPGDFGSVTLWANNFGTPASGVDVALALDLSQIGGGPPVGVPATALSFPSSVTTDADGQAAFSLVASPPGNPRGPIDGQMYGVGWTWSEDVLADPNAFISVRVLDSVPVPAAPTWWDDVFPILVQYSYLYPKMQQIIELDDFNTVVQNISVIVQRLTLSPGNPGYMPIERELSRDKLAILLRWAANPIQGKEPVPPPVMPPLPQWPPPPTTGSGQ